MEQHRPLRAHTRTQPPPWIERVLATRSWLLYASLGTGFVIGLVFTLFRGLVPDQFERDADKIWKIASGAWPGFVDSSFTPVANVYRALGMADAPLLAGLFGFLLASVLIVLASLRSGRRPIAWPLALYIVASFALAGIYLGQYSKDLWVVPVVALLLLPRKLWWELIPIAAMLLYAFWFRDYWALIALGYCGYRLLTLRQVRMRYLLASAALAAVIVSAVFYFVLGRAPNHYRSSVQEILDANTSIQRIEPFAQPLGGFVDVFVNFWLMLLPVTLPLTAGAAYLVVTLALGFVRLLPFFATRSSFRWPGGLDGALVRRGLSLLLSVAAVQALFEPDYGSALRHLVPVMPLGIVVILSMKSALPRMGRADPWSWSGAESSRGPAPLAAEPRASD